MKDIIRLGLRIYTKLKKTCHLTITNLKGLINCMVLIVFRLWSNCDRFAWFDLKAVNFCSVFFFSFKNVAWFNFFNDLLYNILGSAFLDDYQKVFYLCPEGEKNTDLKFSLPKTVSRQNNHCIVNVWSLVKTVKNTDILFGRTYIILFLGRLSFTSASYYTNTVLHLLKKTNEHSLREGDRCFCTKFRFTIFPTISIHCYRQIVKNTEIKLNRLVVKFNINTNIPLELYFLIFTLTMSCWCKSPLREISMQIYLRRALCW